MAKKLQERQFDPNVGGGVDRDKLAGGSFVFPDERKFPVVKPGDVSDAVSSWGRYKGPKSFDSFKRRLIALARRKGQAFVDALPAEWKRDMNESIASTAVIIEQLDLSEAKIDTEQQTVRQRIIRAGMSANGRFYGEDVLQAAVPLFEGTKAYSNHPTRAEQKDRPERSVRDLTGWLTNVAFEGDSLYATRHFTRTQAGQDAWALVEDIVSKRAPASLIGASINAIGKGRKGKVDEKDALIVESIEAVNSVDDVTTPAAGGGFAEANPDSLAAAFFDALDYEEWMSIRPEFTERFTHENRKQRWNEDTRKAKTEASEYRAALAEAQQREANLQERLDAAQQQIETLSKQVQIVEALQRVNLPGKWKADLKEQLMNADPLQWETIIDREIAKAEAAGHRPRVPVQGAGQLVHIPPSSNDAMVEIDWSQVKTPADQARVIESYKKARQNVRNSS